MPYSIKRISRRSILFTLVYGMQLSTLNADEIILYEDAGRAAADFARKNPGIAVGVFLGTESPVTTDQIQTILTKEFVDEGLNDPLLFYFEQNDARNHVFAYYFGHYIDGPFNLAEARPEARNTTKTYLFRKKYGLMKYEED